MDKLTHTGKQELENTVGGRQKHHSYWYYAKCTACSEMLSSKSFYKDGARFAIKRHKNDPNSAHKDHLDKLIIVEEHC
ncbi:MAG: hypothetical protein Q4E88_01550 [Coriobacteriia bacterium]|nr:hypothetical protein [Coriobacteriia bacterium]